MKRIVFVAVIGFTGQQTRDGRVLVAPETGYNLRHGGYPLPVYEKVSPLRVIGEVDQIALCDRRIIAFGHLDPEQVDELDLQHLRDRVAHFGFDVDQVEYQEIHAEDAHLFLSDEIRLVDWRIRALVLESEFKLSFEGLPPVVVEELEYKPREGEITDVGKVSLFGL